MRTGGPVFLVAAIFLASGAPASVQQHRSKYAGMEKREIKTLSAEDIRQLRQGHGWGLSLVAELNGVPGPRHLLDMKEDLGLTPEQVARVEEIYQQMKTEAIPLGEELIRLERELDRGFADRTIDETGLEILLADIARIRQRLRHVHLSAHLRTPPLLTDQQIKKYNILRGYEGEDPCLVIPPGHDPELWRKHNHCEPVENRPVRR